MGYYGGAPAGTQVHDHADGDAGGNVPQSSITGLTAALAAKEASLGNPDVDGKVLQSTAAGARSWAAPAAALAGFAKVYTDLMDALATGGAGGVDFKVTSGRWVGLAFVDSGQFATYGAEAATAVHTVTAGRKLQGIVWSGISTMTDTANRKLRLRNTTDGSDALADTEFAFAYPRELATQDLNTTTIRSSLAAAGKTVKLQIQTATDGSDRAAGGWFIGYEADA